jgi:hypothetical protein
MMYQIKNLIWDQTINQEIYPVFLEYLAIIESRKESLYKNYLLENLDLINHLTFDVIFDKETIVGFGGIYNGGRYPEGVYRILNRTYVDPRYRSQSLRIKPLVSDPLLPHQIKKCWHKLRMIFVSVQDTKGKPYLTKWVRTLAPKLETPWEMSNGFVNVAVGDASKGCFQYIAYNKIDNTVEWPKKIINLDEWCALKDDE